MAERICGFDRQHLTPHAMACARTKLIDTIGVTLTGQAEICTRILRGISGLATAPDLPCCSQWRDSPAPD